MDRIDSAGNVKGWTRFDGFTPIPNPDAVVVRYRCDLLPIRAEMSAENAAVMEQRFRGKPRKAAFCERAENTLSGDTVAGLIAQDMCKMSHTERGITILQQVLGVLNLATGGKVFGQVTEPFVLSCLMPLVEERAGRKQRNQADNPDDFPRVSQAFFQDPPPFYRFAVLQKGKVNM